jgi:hypothetical protein
MELHECRFRAFCTVYALANESIKHSPGCIGAILEKRTSGAAVNEWWIGQPREKIYGYLPL